MRLELNVKLLPNLDSGSFRSQTLKIEKIKNRNKGSNRTNTMLPTDFRIFLIES